jgi:hypothetical protein
VEAGTNRLGAHLLAWVIALTVVGYPLAGLLAVGFGLESTATSIPFRLLVVVIAGLAALTYASAGGRFHLNLAILVFWWLYAIRILFDIGTGDFEDMIRHTLFFLGVVVIPATAVMVAGGNFDELITARVIFIICALTSFFSIIMNAIGFTELTVQTGRLQFDTVNAITLGHSGVSSLIAGFVIWPSLRTPAARVLVGAGVLASLVLVVLAASRGPVLALVLVIVSFLVLRGQWGLIAAGVLSAAFLIPSLLFADGFTIFSRFTDLGRDLSVLERLDIQKNAVDQFVDSPIFGSAHVELVSGYYPHNLFIEAAMALGIFGLLVYLLIVMRSGYLAFLQLRRGGILMPLLFVQYFVNGNLSDYLLGGAFWLIMAMIFAIGYRAVHADPQGRLKAGFARHPA